MKVRFKTSGILEKYLPAGANNNACVLDLPEGATAIDVMTHLGLPTAERYMVALNGGLLPSAERPTRVLVDDDELAIMPPLKGG
ncbi:MAG: MoaD/ThiS family protein [Alphaproteobacteria bacterium]|nr:MoaD/ThiS family protein [Alphaproteobacteria bacterium]